MPYRGIGGERGFSHKLIVGEKIHRVRKDRQLTLKELASRSGVSAAHISELERGRISPTVATLVKISEALGKAVSFFLPDEELHTIRITKGDEQELVASQKCSRRILSKGVYGSKLVARQVELEQGGEVERPQEVFLGESLAVILKGEIEVIMNEERHRLREGDTIHMRGGLPTVMKNAGKTKAELIFVRTVD